MKKELEVCDHCKRIEKLGKCILCKRDVCYAHASVLGVKGIPSSRSIVLKPYKLKHSHISEAFWHDKTAPLICFKCMPKLIRKVSIAGARNNEAITKAMMKALISHLSAVEL